MNMINFNPKTKWSKKDDFMVICKVPIEKMVYVVNGVRYYTLKEAAVANNISVASLSMYLSGRRRSKNISIIFDTETIYKEEKHRLSHALYNKYEVVRKAD